MVVRIRFYFHFLNILILVRSGYPPQGDEVQMGSVLLPATRRGRYLANIVRRQAVDGTGIKFNKDADRMNAEAKKKVDVLSEELLPYIIAEQERRTTLYKRVMTAIQNGEKGVTIAEIRNKPPLIIRKGLMYRCPANRAPKEPDGSGVIMCEQDIEPTPVMYDSCLSAEDKELYVADSRYFFCNRHKVEGPDLPRNGSTVIGCAPLERTSLNYTTGKCALEDTDDVVVHYRYYPDKTYKFVTELDPDHEVCDHWNPCQIGYIYSLPSPDQAMPANELWHDYEERPDEYEKDEIVPPIPEDNPEEYVTDQSRSEYVTSIRKLEVPEGYKFHGIGRYSLQNIRTRLTVLDKVLSNYTNIRVKVEPPPAARRRQAEEGATAAPASETPASDAPATGASSGGANAATAVVSFVKIQLFFSPITSEDITHYYVRFESATKPGSYKYKTIVILYRATAQLAPVMEDVLPGQTMNTTIIPLRCGKCIVKSMMVRAVDGGIANLDMSRYRVRTENDHKNIEVELGKTFFHDFGDYFIVLQTEDGNEERIKALSVNGPDSSGGDVKCSRRVDSIDVGTHIDNTIKWECEDCTLEDVLCEGESVIPGGRVSIVGSSRFVSFNFPSFENENACVYIGIFSSDNKKFKRTLQIIDNNSPSVHVEKMDAQPPVEGTQFEIEVPYQCQGDCSIEKVTLDGVALEAMTRRSVPASGIAFFLYTPTALTIRITSFSASFMGIYQAVFNVASGSVTKTVLEIKDPNDKSELATNDAETTAAAEAASAAEGDTTPAAGAEGDTTAADAAAAEGETAAGEATTAAEGDGAPAEDASPADGEASPADDAPPAEGETEAPAK